MGGGEIFVAPTCKVFRLEARGHIMNTSPGTTIQDVEDDDTLGWGDE